MAPKQPRTNASHNPASGPQPTPLTATAGRRQPSQEELQDQIRHRAYELWEQRGRQGGSAEQDWLQAEKEVLARHGRIAA